MDAQPQKLAGTFERRQLAARAGGVVCLAVALGVNALHAQLAITEVMSSASTNRGPNVVRARPDFWELTNFGTNTISLDGYSFSDSGGWTARVDTPFNGCSIDPLESIIFVKTDP